MAALSHDLPINKKMLYFVAQVKFIQKYIYAKNSRNLWAAIDSNTVQILCGTLIWCWFCWIQVMVFEWQYKLEGDTWKSVYNDVNN